MNRVENNVIQIKRCLDTINLLEAEYSEGKKRKGTIYYSTRDHNTRKIADLIKKTRDLGKGVINKWDILYMDKNDVRVTEILFLDSSITKEEIISYYSSVLGVNRFQIIKMKEFVKTGFPRKL